MNNKKMWALMLYLSHNQWAQKHDIKTNPELDIEDSFLDYILEECVKVGINTILLDVGDGIQYATHPEISVKGAWSKKRVRDEVKRFRDKGIALIPKLNFSTGHCYWLGEYRRMISTSIYYKVCDDLIKEIYEAFDHPEYIHLGMDEENYEMGVGNDFVVVRQSDLYWHDMRFLLDSVIETGAKPWIWSDSAFEHPEEFKACVEPGEVLISPWHYHALDENHFTPTDSRPEYVDYYFKKGPFVGMNLKYVEDDPFHMRFRTHALALCEYGYEYVPCSSVYNHCDRNNRDLMWYFKTKAPEERIIGFMAAPWCNTRWENKEKFDETFKLFSEARKEIYGE